MRKYRIVRAAVEQIVAYRCMAVHPIRADGVRLRKTTGVGFNQS